MTVEAPERDVKAEIDELLDEYAPPKDPLADAGLPGVLGDYRGVEGHIGWFMRPMKLRQQLQALAILNAAGERSNVEWMRDTASIAACLLWRLEATAETVRDVLRAWSQGQANPWRPASEEEIMDAFDMDDLTEHVLAPMGFDMTGKAEPGGPGNAAG